MSVERTIAIDRPPSTVFTLLNGFQSFDTWSPLVARDPHAEYRISGPVAGVGARLSWTGDPRQVGNGWQEIIESVPFERIRMQMDFDHQGRAVSYFKLQGLNPGTQLVWGFNTNLVEGQGMFGALLARYFGLFFDRWIGTDYEQGLARFRKFAESLPATDFSDLEVELMRVDPFNILYVRTSSQPITADPGGGLAEAFGEIEAFIRLHSIERLAPPMLISRGWDALNHEVDAAIPVGTVDVVPSGNIQAGISPSGIAVRAVHRGPYSEMAPTYEKLSAFMAVNRLEEGRVSWEHYVRNPSQVPDSELITHIYMLVGEPAKEQP